MLTQIISLNSFTHEAQDKMNVKILRHGHPSQGRASWRHQKQMPEPRFFPFSTEDGKHGLVCEGPSLPKEKAQDGPGVMAQAVKCLLTCMWT